MVRLWLAFFAVAGAVLQLALPSVLGRTIDGVLRADTGMMLPCALLIAAVVVCDSLETWATGATGAAASARLRERVVRHLLGAGPALTRDYAEGELVTRAGLNAEEAGQATQARIAAVAMLIPTAGGLVALVLIDPWLALALLGALILIAFVLKAFYRDFTSMAAGYQQAQGDIAARLVDALTGARTIAAAGTVPAETARVLQPLPRLRAHGLGLWRANARAGVQAGLVVPLLEVVVLAVGGLRLAAGDLSVGDLYAAVRYAVMGAGLSSALGQFSVLARARAARARIDELLAEPQLTYGDHDAPEGPGTLQIGDLTIPGGTLVAVVGRSGSGKSHFAATIGRLAPPPAVPRPRGTPLPGAGFGQVRLDGVPVDKLSRRALRRSVAYAFERPVLVGATLGEAITLGRPGADPANAALSARADAFIRAMPEGYTTPLEGVPLSGGERQRIGLARAFAHAEQILILDDATSSLDTVTERQVSIAVSEAGGTRLVVTHRASTAAAADLVIWLDSGEIRGCAPHTELWADPEYRSVFA